MGHSGAKRVVRTLGVLGAAGWSALACSGASGAIDPAALPAPDAPALGRSVDVSLTDGAAALAVFDDGNGHGTVEPGPGYRLGIRQNESVVSSTLSGVLPADQVVEASFATEGSPLDAAFGVVCRARSNDTYYRLGVGNDGTYAIARVQDGASTVLTGGGKWVKDRRLPAAPGFFLIGAECRGENLTLFANNQPIVSAHDPDGLDGPGRAGVFVETFAEPDATVTVNHVAARAYPDRERVPDETIGPWDAFVRRQIAARRCTLLDPGRVDAPGRPRFATRCGTTLYVSYPDAPGAVRAYHRILDEAGTELDAARRLPNCRTHTGVSGPLPGIGRVACLDLGDATAVLWVDEGAGLVGITRIGDDARAAWRGYGPDWPPFVR